MANKPPLSPAAEQATSSSNGRSAGQRIPIPLSTAPSTNGTTPALDSSQVMHSFWRMLDDDGQPVVKVPVQPHQAAGKVAVKPFLNGTRQSTPVASVSEGGVNSPLGILPDVMSQTSAPAVEVPPAPETIEHVVGRLRPKTFAMQVRFFHTLFFALWLFGRLVFWQIYAAEWFPEWVNKRNDVRWRKYARQFRRFAIHMGGVMIKAGQFASTRADILPEIVIQELVSLQDEVPTIPYEEIRTVLLRELGAVETRYRFFDQVPIAAASLGQAHRAELHDGTNVVVKVQRPGIREIIYTDMAALFIVAHVAMRFGFVRRRMDMVGLAEEFGRVLLEEISYEKEAQHAERFREMYANDGGVYIPRVHRSHSTDFVITIEDVTSIKLNDYASLAAAGIDRREVARRLMDTYLRQIFEERFFHADPHPGNLFIYPLPVPNEQYYIQQGGGRPFYLIFIDFGMTSTLTRELVQGMINTLVAVITRDAKKLVQSYVELGFILPNADTKRIEQATEMVFEQVWGMSIADMRNMDFGAVQNIGKEFNDLLYDFPFRVPQDLIYLGRTVGILTGMATALDPDFNPWTEIQGNIQKLVTTDAEFNVVDEVSKVVREPLELLLEGDWRGFLGSLQRVIARFQQPNKAEIMLQKIVDGDVALVTKPSPQYRRQLERIEIQGQRNTRAIVFAAFFIGGTMLQASDPNLAGVAYAAAAVAFVAMLFVRQ